MLTADDWIRQLNLARHPEGGWFRETYRAAETVAGSALPARFGGPRHLATAIYFLLQPPEFSAFHRVKADEMWHFYAGAPLTLHLISPAGDYTSARLGSAADGPAAFQALVPADTWQAAELDEPGGFALVGCTVAPGFDFADFELAARAALCRLCPGRKKLVERLTHV